MKRLVNGYNVPERYKEPVLVPLYQVTITDCASQERTFLMYLTPITLI